jgi:glycosyltransferase involved in cell wall biosynthesis
VATPARVLWLIKGLGPGGAERLLVESARFVDRDRFQVRAAYLLPWKDHLVTELEDGGVPVVCLGARRELDPGWVRGLRHLVRAGAIDLVHAHSPVPAIAARTALRGPAVVTTEHNTWDRYRPVTRRVNALTFGRQRAAIAVSQEVARSFGQRTRPPVHVIANGVDVGRIRERAMPREAARDELGLPPDVPVVGAIGGLTAKKGFVFLVRAARRVLEAVPRARVVIVGLPIDDAPVRAAIAAEGLGEQVVLAGYRPEAARLLPAFDVFALPSLFEGMPVSLLEAMAAGLPSVASRVGGVPEVATDGVDALLVPPADEAELAAALVALLTDDARRSDMGAAARSTAERFSLEETVRRTQDVYDEALASRVARP